MVRRDTAIARVAAHRLKPGPDRISPPRNLRLLTDRAVFFIVSQQLAAAKRGIFPRKESRDTMPFTILALLVAVLAAVTVLFGIFFLVRRWL